MRKILLLSAYDAVSHQHWRKGLVAAFPEYEWTVLTLPPRHFSWRIRGNSLSWAYSQRKTIEQAFDLVIATSMTDLSALKGMVPALANTPSLLYFHENQFDYPQSGKETSTVEPQITSIYAALAADRIAFNSEYNRQTYLNGADALLRKLPDHVPLGVKGILEDRSVVLPVPLNEEWLDPCPRLNNRFTLLWNHRWEFDKAPERLFAALLRLRDSGSDFCIHVVGQRFRNMPKVFDKIRDELGENIATWGFIADHVEYRQLVRQSHVVISTALHDFQGLSILEATAAGCIPCVPDRLAYPEFIPEKFRYESRLDDDCAEAEALATVLIRLGDLHRANRLPAAPDLSRLFWPTMRERYKKEIEALMNKSGK